MESRFIGSPCGRWRPSASGKPAGQIITTLVKHATCHSSSMGHFCRDRVAGNALESHKVPGQTIGAATSSAARTIIRRLHFIALTLLTLNRVSRAIRANAVRRILCGNLPKDREGILGPAMIVASCIEHGTSAQHRTSRSGPVIIRLSRTRHHVVQGLIKSGSRRSDAWQNVFQIPVTHRW